MHVLLGDGVKPELTFLTFVILVLSLYSNDEIVTFIRGIICLTVRVKTQPEIASL